MILETVLAVNLFHYGFYLALPATLMAVVCLVYVLPRHLQKKGRNGSLLRIWMLAFCFLFMGSYVRNSAEFYRGKSSPVGLGKDLFYTFDESRDERVRRVKQFLAWSEDNTSRNSTVVVMPEGIMLNYLTRLVNPTRHINFMLPEVLLAGEQQILTDFKRTLPDYVVILDRDTSEYGVGPFGDDPRYGLRIMNWVRQNYRRVFPAASAQLSDEGPEALVIWRHRKL